MSLSKLFATPKVTFRIPMSARRDACRSLLVTAELGVGGALDLSLCPLADESGDIVVPEAGADLEGHEL